MINAPICSNTTFAYTPTSTTSGVIFSWTRANIVGITNPASSGSGPINETLINTTPNPINVIDTFEYKTITIPGDTSGTWNTTNGYGLAININLGAGSAVSGTAGSWANAFYCNASSTVNLVGTNGATFYITGVQLEQNTSATPFERRLYNQELANCQRYYAKSYAQGTVPGTSTNLNIAAQSSGGGVTGVEVSSDEQDKTIAKMLSRNNSFLIKVRFGDKN